MEAITLTTPVVKPSILTYTPFQLNINKDNGIISVDLRGSDGTVIHADYTITGLYLNNGFINLAAPKGPALIISFNKANFSVTSLDKQIMQRLIADAPSIFAGNVTGVVD